MIGLRRQPIPSSREKYMPIIELDMLIAFVNRVDKLHETASKIFNKIIEGDLKGVAVPAAAYMEYELVFRSRGVSGEEILEDLNAFKLIRNLGEVPLTIEIIIDAAEIRAKYGLTYFDSLHAASALHLDGVIISTDKAYKKVKELKTVDPTQMS